NPSSTISQPDKDFLFQLRTYAKQTDSSVVFVHNHPSGHVEPSQADIDTTNYIKNFFNIDDKNHFAGHIILDHGTFGLYEANQNKWFALINEKFHSMEEGKEYFSIQGSDIGLKQIRNKNDLIQLSEYAQKIDRTGDYNINEWIPAFFATHNGIVRTLDYINNDDFSVENTNLLQAHLKFVGRESGSNHVYFVPKTHQQKMLCEAFAQQTGIVQDVFYLKEDGSYELSKWSGGDIFNTLSEEEIKRDDSLNYEIPKTKENEIMDNIKQEINVEEEFDKFVESMDVNGGLPEAALEADYEAELSSRDDYYDEEEVLDDNIIENQISTFDKELQQVLENKLSDNHIFTLGKPSEILQKCGFPENQRIELSLSHLKYKASLNRHPFELDNLFGLEEALQNPIGVFEYGDKQKSQNVFVDIEKEGPAIELSPIFPEKVNVEFVRVVNSRTLKMRVWERGNGETLACGTGACAAAIAAVENGFCEKNVDITVKVPGGDLIVNYSDDGVVLTGNAQQVYEGKVSI
ncbi:MAG: diaminopimelate epimerase, partial [Clostridia bacterium]|nr:diaminopimelate epimerase [Clostridia bacterium]